ncbi:MAG: FAD binding domain-containing protein [Acidimicrobiales bacterium]
MTFTIATSLVEVLAAMADGARPIAGGTDLVVSARQGKASLPVDLVAIDRIEELAGIDSTDTGLTIGAGVTHAQLMQDLSIVDHYSALADAAALVGSPSTRNIGTIGGNIMNASPAMDTGAPLVVLGATIELQTASGTRSIAIGELWTGPAKTSASEDELCVSLNLPSQPDRTGSAYVRLEYRRAMEIAIVGAAARVSLNDDETVAAIQVALTAVAPTILAVDGLSAIEAKPIDEATLAAVANLASEQASPISDVRASDAYRRHTVGVMARRAVDAAARRARGESIAVPVNRALGIGAIQ